MPSKKYSPSGPADALTPPVPKLLDLLAIEANMDRPLLETAGEICISSAREGQTVTFCFLSALLRGDNSTLQKIPLLRAPQYRLKKLESLLALHGVHSIPDPRLPRDAVDRAKKFASQLPKTMGEIGELTYDSSRLGLGVLSSLIDHVGDQFFVPSDFQFQMQKLLYDSAISYEITKKALEQVKPKRVLVFNGRFAVENAIFEAARRNDVNVIFYERGADYSRYDIFEERRHDLRYLRNLVKEAWADSSNGAKMKGSVFFTQSRRNNNVQYLSFTGLQVEGLAPLRSSKRRLVYFTSSDDEIAAVGDFIEHILFQSQRHAIQFLIEWVGSQPDVELIIRVHPHLQEKSDSNRNWWESLSGTNVSVLPSNSPVDSYALASSADAVLSYGSTMGLEAAFMEKPTILLGDALYRGFECCYEPQSVPELTELLARHQLPPFPKEACLPIGYYLMTHGKPFEFYKPQDRYSGTFMGDELNSLAPFAARLAATKLGMIMRTQVRNVIRRFGLEAGSDEVWARTIKRNKRSRFVPR